MSAPRSRLARQLRPYLGPRLWAEFVAHASRRYKVAWLRALTPASGVLCCVGTIDGSPCPHGVEADLLADEGSVAPELERLDYERHCI